MTVRSPPAVRRIVVAAAVATVCGLTGCAPPPVYVATNHARVVALSPADVWRRMHLFLQNLQIPVVSEDRQAGIIDASLVEPEKGLVDRYAYCQHHWNGLHPLASERLDLTILIQPAPEGAKVMASTAFSETLRQRRAGAFSFACNSKGVLEAAILNVAAGQPMDAAVVPQ